MDLTDLECHTMDYNDLLDEFSNATEIINVETKKNELTLDMRVRPITQSTGYQPSNEGLENIIDDKAISSMGLYLPLIQENKEISSNNVMSVEVEIPKHKNKFSIGDKVKINSTHNIFRSNEIINLKGMIGVILSINFQNLTYSMDINGLKVIIGARGIAYYTEGYNSIEENKRDFIEFCKKVKLYYLSRRLKHGFTNLYRFSK